MREEAFYSLLPKEDVMTSVQRKLTGILEVLPRPWIFILCLAVIAGVGFVDYLTGREVSVALIYVIPISMASWYLGRTAGLGAAVGSETAWFISDFLIAHARHETGIAYWNALMRLGVFLTYAVILSNFKAMLDRLEREKARSQTLAEQILSAQEQERQRVSRELHDEAGQALAGLTLRIEEMKLTYDSSRRCLVPVEELEHLKTMACRVSAEIRRLAFNLRPAMLEDLGLAHSLASLLRDQLRKKGVRVSFSMDDPELRLSPEIELALYRIVQEAVANIVKYANATEVAAKLARNSGRVILEISDNGTGFEPAALSRNKNRHLGILGMEERVALLGGSFRLVSSGGNGTHISISIPMQAGKTENNRQAPHPKQAVPT